jgi:selenide,water dikinase
LSTRATPRLTELSHGAGCACKISAADLEHVLGRIPASEDPDLLVGAANRDDAAVYRVSDELALVQTADFFTPIVDDPTAFGRIAATNALSDVYAMGARPLVAINLLAYSIADLGPDLLAEILSGGAAAAAAAGVAIGGGHSIDDPEPKYGMAVTGVVHPDEVLTNGGGHPGDELYISKPVGGGLITTGAKRQVSPAATVAAAIEVMCTLNAAAAGAARRARATAVTDVTGFGLLGHMHELAEASGVAAVVDAKSIPAIDGALELADRDECVSGGSRRNAEHADAYAEWGAAVEPPRRVLATDAMTSGGLLVAVPAGEHPEGMTRIGRLIDGPAGHISVT